MNYIPNRLISSFKYDSIFPKFILKRVIEATMIEFGQPSTSREMYKGRMSSIEEVLTDFSVSEDQIFFLMHQTPVSFMEGLPLRLTSRGMMLPVIPIINYDVMNIPGMRQISSRICGIEAYGMRGLGQPWAGEDAVILVAEPRDSKTRENLATFIKFQYEQGVGPHQNYVIQVPLNSHTTVAEAVTHNQFVRNGILKLVQSFNTLHGKRAMWWPYYSHDKEEKAAQSLGIEYFGVSTPEAELFNDKIKLFHTALELGIPVAPGNDVQRNDDVERMKRVMGEMLRTYGPKVIARGHLGATAASSWSFSEQDILEKAIEIAADTEMDAHLYQHYYRYRQDSPSNLWRIGDEIKRLAHTGDQLLDGDAHLGNRIPSRVNKKLVYNMDRRSAVLAIVLEQNGFKGDFGIDYFTTKQQSRLQFTGIFDILSSIANLMFTPLEALLAEINARGTGQSVPASFYSRTLHMHGAGAVLALNVETMLPLDDILSKGKESNIWYSPEREVGAIITNPGPLIQAHSLSKKFTPAFRGRNSREVIAQASNFIDLMEIKNASLLRSKLTQ